MIIRDETAHEIDEIAEVTKEAFRTLAISNHTEQFIIAALRAGSAAGGCPTWRYWKPRSSGRRGAPENPSGPTL